MKLRGFLAASALALALVLTGCGGGGAGAASTGPAPIAIGTDQGADLKFVPDTAEAPANAAVKLTFTNNSTSQPHNLFFQQGITAQTEPSIAPGGSQTIEFTTPAAGSYRFVCTLHPGMEGTLNVK